MKIGDNQLLFLEIKMFWFFEPAEEMGGQMAARKIGTTMFRLNTCLIPFNLRVASALCLTYALSSLHLRPATLVRQRAWSTVESGVSSSDNLSPILPNRIGLAFRQASRLDSCGAISRRRCVRCLLSGVLGL